GALLRARCLRGDDALGGVRLGASPAHQGQGDREVVSQGEEGRGGQRERAGRVQQQGRWQQRKALRPRDQQDPLGLGRSPTLLPRDRQRHRVQEGRGRQHAGPELRPRCPRRQESRSFRNGAAVVLYDISSLVPLAVRAWV
ncbi:hypothetical protein T484DRAFT_3629999, partial [Baffinella frigidus]